MVERGLADADLVGDILQRHPPIPFDGEDLRRGAQDLQMAFLLRHAFALFEAFGRRGVSHGHLMGGEDRLGLARSGDTVLVEDLLPCCDGHMNWRPCW